MQKPVPGRREMADGISCNAGVQENSNLFYFCLKIASNNAEEWELKKWNGHFDEFGLM